jgi:hypothetical protein
MTRAISHSKAANKLKKVFPVKAACFSTNFKYK